MERERRRVPRFQFIAPAELVEEPSGARINSWVADLGSQGCGLSGSGSLRDGTPVQLKIYIDPREVFRARAVVVHANSQQLGLIFSDVNPKSSTLLNRWLAEAKFPRGPV